jgi:Di-haem oxidoreductase, putative peroxidase
MPPDASPTPRRAAGSVPRPDGLGNSNGLLAPRTLAGVGQASQDGWRGAPQGCPGGDGRGTGAMGRLEGNTTVAALRYQDVHLFSDLALHGMGPGHADGLSQGAAKGDEFRTALLGRLGPRIFFLHDGCTTDLVEAMQAHRSAGNSQYDPSETNQVINGIAKARRSEIHCRCAHVADAITPRGVG